jgi:hypothetical protein
LNPTTLLVLDADNNRIRSIDLTHQTVNTLTGTGAEGNADGKLLEATFESMNGFAVDTTTGLIVVTCLNAIRYVDTKTGLVSSFDNSKRIIKVSTGAVFVPGNNQLLVIGDARAHVLWCINRSTNEVTRLAGSATNETGDTDGNAHSKSEFRAPVSLVFEPKSGDLIVCDQDAMKIRKIVFNTKSTATATAVTATATAPTK